MIERMNSPLHDWSIIMIDNVLCGYATGELIPTTNDNRIDKIKKTK